MKFKNKVIVITGAGSGMGRELTIQLVKKGAKVAMADINEQGMIETAKICSNTNISIHILNINDRESVRKFPEVVIKQHGNVDGIINNAGIIQPFLDVNELDYEKIEHVMNINFYGTLYMTKSFLPYLLKRPEAHIANISSMGGFMPFPKQTLYGASKAAVKLLTEGLYAELKDTQVGVTIIFPGAIDTNIMSNSGLISTSEQEKLKKEQNSKALPAEKAASIIINGIEKNRYRILVGSDARLLDILYRINPKKAVHFIVKQMSKMNITN